MIVEQKRLKAFLEDSKLIGEKDLEKAWQESKRQNKLFEDFLVFQNLIEKEEIIKLKAYILGIPFVNLEKEKISPEILRIIPEPIAKNHNIIAFRKQNNSLEVAMLDPEDLKTIEFIKKKANLKIIPRLTNQSSIKSALSQYHKSLEAEFGEIIKKDAKEIKIIQQKETTEDLKKIAKDVPIIRIVDTLIKHAVLQKASDIHIEPAEKEILVRYRIDGILRQAMVLPKNVSAGIVARIKVLANLKIDEHRLPQDGRFKIDLDDLKYAVRVSVLPVFNGEKIVMRLLAEQTETIGLESLGLTGTALESVHHSIKKPIGMILVTGPTGSGKTTTLYTLLEMLNTLEVNISTIEDPIEYQITRINQTQVNPKIGLTFANGLRSLVRQDPDIIMIGEIRDEETAALSINAALTGHLVLSTLHTSNAAGTISRLFDMKAEPFLISSTLKIIIAQRLVRKLCPSKKKYFLKEAEIDNLANYCDIKKITQFLKEEKIVKEDQSLKDVVFYKPQPSQESQDGYKGRIGIFEVLNITESIKELIVQNSPENLIQQRAEKEGMKTMIEDGFLKAAKGLTSIEEILRVITE
ncbi:MAG: GspE/PulE family protein [Candidatus Pacebacteria bacterium]|nr:GspE/PulE family protein [Candidatus Paceibacterota bacterium]